MSYKNGAKYIKISSLYEGNIDEDIIVASANESTTDITKYHIIVDGRIVETILEDDAAEDEFSIIDALYYLKHGVPQKSKCEVKDDLTRDEVDMLFKDDEVPQKFKDK